MAATKEDINRWIATALRLGCKYVVSVCDTFSYDDYAVYCNDEEELDQAKKKYDGQNMQRINEIITVEDHRDVVFSNLKSILTEIKSGRIDYGFNKQYCFVMDPDGDLCFLKRVHNHDSNLDEHGEQRDNWPENHYDGKVLHKQHCGERRGAAITEELLEIMGVEFLH